MLAGGQQAAGNKQNMQNERRLNIRAVQNGYFVSSRKLFCIVKLQNSHCSLPSFCINSRLVFQHKFNLHRLQDCSIEGRPSFPCWIFIITDKTSSWWVRDTFFKLFALDWNMKKKTSLLARTSLDNDSMWAGRRARGWGEFSIKLSVIRCPIALSVQ